MSVSPYGPLFERIAFKLRQLDAETRGEIAAVLDGSLKVGHPDERALLDALRRSGAARMLALMLDAIEVGADPVDRVLEAAENVSAARCVRAFT